MSPVENGTPAPAASANAPAPSGGDAPPAPAPVTPPPAAALVDPQAAYLVVSWDLDATGRRLLDEICQIAAFYRPPGEGGDPAGDSTGSAKDDSAEGSAGSAANAFSQYVMPHKNPNPGARRSFGIRVVNIGRYRMLKDMETGKVLKTKSEISALQEFLDWLKAAKTKFGKDGVLLACHEPTRKVLVPLLLEALYKYNLMDDFKATVKGFVNAIHVVGKYGDPDKVTSLSLRSLCKTVLADTNPTTSSASDRCKVLVDIMGKLVGAADSSLDDAKVATVAVTVTSEEDDLRKLKGMLGTQGTLRPIFESQLRQKRSVRERAMALRKQVAESGLDYAALAAIYRGEEDARQVLAKKVRAFGEEELDELVELLKAHFDVGGKKAKEDKEEEEEAKEVKVKEEKVEVKVE